MKSDTEGRYAAYVAIVILAIAALLLVIAAVRG